MVYVDNEDIGHRARELDSLEIIHRIRIGRRTMIRVCIAVCIWILMVCIMRAL